MQRSGRLLSISVSIAALAAAFPAAAESLPVFKLAAPAVADGKANVLFNDVFIAPTGGPAIRGGAAAGGALTAAPSPAVRSVDPKAQPQISGAARDALTKQLDIKPVATNNAWTLERNRQLVEIDRRSGFIFLADFNLLWKPDLKPQLPDNERAKGIADAFLAKHDLMPRDQFAQAKFVGFSETAVGEDIAGKVDKTVLDRQVNYAMSIEVDGRSIPVVGGGSGLKVTVGDQGRVIGLSGGWRPVEGVIEKVEIVPAAEVLGQVKKSFGKAKVSDLRADIAYYAAPGFEAQQVLAPVWVINGLIEIGGEMAPIRTQTIAATKQYGPVLVPGPAAPKRDPKLRDPAPTREDEGQRGASLLDVIIPPAHAQELRECGASWIGVSQGLNGSAGNRQGFLDQCRAAGWRVNFDWGDANAFESDWRRNDDSWVDAADLVFYTGHASPNGWNLSSPDDDFLHFSEVSGASDHWGQNDLEWVIVAACGPHQSNHFTTSVGNAFDRWRDAFDGLHVFLGYGAVTFDNTTEGRRFMELARAGWSTVDAWFRTAQEVQPATNGWAAPNGPTIWVTAMWAHNGDHCARNEKIHGVGPSCPDVRGAGQRRHLMWSGT